MYVVRDGPRHAPPLVLIHGSGATNAFWGPVVPALAGDHHVIRIDLPGHGQSPPASSYEVPAQADRVAAALDGLGIRNASVAAHSSGGYVATALATGRPDLVRMLTLISSGPSLDAVSPQPVLLRALLAPPLGPLLWAVRSDAMVRRAVVATCARPVAVPDDVVAGLRATGYRTTRRVLQQHTSYLRQRTLPERLAGLEVPVLVIFGSADPRWDPTSVRQYEAVPQARIEVLAGVGHLPMLEAPEEVGELILAAALQQP
ncbi:alpha/beta fold hydrolase [Micromonospora andamanensis]|uniref:Alpha/beta hydrolase n=2 Tax=Micromonospora andamanensis TaxID=1287068 RepID=A0ABQ4I1Y7_9ACTN|nr:alpha/beta hydrolase [Micromonospora andamanensis]GIJ42977.1 alpha/beta hydrolase [Micromonospora andamanensis]